MAQNGQRKITPADILYGPRKESPPYNPLTPQGQLNASFVVDFPFWQEHGVAPSQVYTPPPPPPPRLPPPPPPQQQQQHYAAPPPAAAQSAVAGYTKGPAAPASTRPVRRCRVSSSPRKAAAPAQAHAPGPSASSSAPAPASAAWKPYGTRSKTAAHSVTSLSLIKAQSLIAETFKRDPDRVVCPLAGCEKACASPDALQQHILGSHVGKMYSCPRCEKSYQSQRALDSHKCIPKYHY